MIVTSNRYTEPRPLFANNTNGLSKDGFDVEFTMNFNDKDDPKDGDVTTLDRFEAPGALRLFTKVGDDGSCHIGETYTSPAKPGWSNVMIRQTVVKTKDGKVPVTGRQTRDGQIKVSLMMITTKSLLQILKCLCTYHSFLLSLSTGSHDQLYFAQVGGTYLDEQVSQPGYSVCAYPREELSQLWR